MRTYTQYHILEHNDMPVPQNIREICDKSPNPLPGSVEISQYDDTDEKCMMCGRKARYCIDIWTHHFNETYEVGNFCENCLKVLRRAMQKAEDGEWVQRKGWDNINGD